MSTRKKKTNTKACYNEHDYQKPAGVLNIKHDKVDVRLPKGKIPDILIYYNEHFPQFMIDLSNERIRKYRQKAIFSRFIIMMSDENWAKFDKIYNLRLYEKHETFTIFDFAEHLGFKLDSRMKNARQEAEEEMRDYHYDIYLEEEKERQYEEDQLDAAIEEEERKMLEDEEYLQQQIELYELLDYSRDVT